MNKIIEQQLQQVCVADLSNYNEKTNTFLIKKYCKPAYKIGQCYLVHLPRYYVSDLITINYNNNIKPKYEYLKIYVSSILGKMIKVDAIYYDHVSKQDVPNETWSGYLSIDEIEQLTII